MPHHSRSGIYTVRCTSQTFYAAHVHYILEYGIRLRLTLRCNNWYTTLYGYIIIITIVHPWSFSPLLCLNINDPVIKIFANCENNHNHKFWNACASKNAKYKMTHGYSMLFSSSSSSSLTFFPFSFFLSFSLIFLYNSFPSSME